MEYLKMAFVFVGAAIIFVALVRSMRTTLRRLRLREKARNIHGNETAAQQFLRMVTVEDISYDTYLKTVVDKLTGQLPSEPGTTAGIIPVEPVTAQ